MVSEKNGCRLRRVLTFARSPARAGWRYEQVLLDEDFNILTAFRTHESRFPQILLISRRCMAGLSTLIIAMGADIASRIREVARCSGTAG